MPPRRHPRRHPARQHDRAMQAAEALVKIFEAHLHRAAASHDPEPQLSALIHLASSLGVGWWPQQSTIRTVGFELHDVLTCIRTLTTLDDIHPNGT